MRWFRVLALFVSLTASAAPIAGAALERAETVDVREVRDERRARTSISITPRAPVAPSRTEAREPATSDRIVLVPDRWLRHCALLC